MVIVKFLSHNAPYNAGEVAGFSSDVAQRLVAAGRAEYVAAKVKKPGRPSQKQTREMDAKSIGRPE
jgi:hypothetical protein